MISYTDWVKNMRWVKVIGIIMHRLIEPLWQYYVNTTYICSWSLLKRTANFKIWSMKEEHETLNRFTYVDNTFNLCQVRSAVVQWKVIVNQPKKSTEQSHCWIVFIHDYTYGIIAAEWFWDKVVKIIILTQSKLYWINFNSQLFGEHPLIYDLTQNGILKITWYQLKVMTNFRTTAHCVDTGRSVPSSTIIPVLCVTQCGVVTLCTKLSSTYCISSTKLLQDVVVNFWILTQF